ncbi:AAA family ATPase [Sphaerisporangium corydalis]|uniref:AAA family ATPase n=1 Tax=Sphaerisporangium corydalis TaxID=1441875 RepID=A0ABV9ETY8_9ACTN|nr:AAA family ATPase [Sphaerisporangium corydalis]
MRRVLVAGITGAGKTTMARRLAQATGLPFHQLDELAFLSGWRERPEYLADVVRLSESEAWIFDSWGDRRVRDRLWSCADTVVWLDFSFTLVTRRLLWRSLLRTTRREQIFNGNVETAREWFGRDHPLWSAWAEYRPRRAEMRRRLADPAHAHLHLIRLPSPKAADRWLKAVTPSA